MSINAPYGTQISAAYFDPEERKIYVLEETKDNWNWDLAMLCQLTGLAMSVLS